MKQTKAICSLLLVGILFFMTSGIAPSEESAPVQISYYWFNTSNSYLGRQTTVATEIAMTGYDESTSNPKTLREKGWGPGSVTIVNGTPVPNSSTPDKELYSHP